MNETKKGFLHSVRQSVLTTLVLLLICGLLFPLLLSGLSAVLFPWRLPRVMPVSKPCSFPR